MRAPAATDTNLVLLSALRSDCDTSAFRTYATTGLDTGPAFSVTISCPARPALYGAITGKAGRNLIFNLRSPSN